MEEMTEVTYKSETPISASDLESMAYDRVRANIDGKTYKFGYMNPELAITDPIQSSAENNCGLWQNSYSQTSRYLPPTPDHCKSTYKASVAFNDVNADRPDELADRTARVVEYALFNQLKSETDRKIAVPAYVQGTVNTVVEKFAWKIEMVENTVAKTLVSESGPFSNYDIFNIPVEDVANRENKGHDIVLEGPGGREVTFQVKTNNDTDKKQADYLIQVECDTDETQIEFQIME